MKKIPLTRGKFAIVDDADFVRLNKHKWCAVKEGNTWYATRNILLPNGKQTKMAMHRQILGLHLGDGNITDHRNHNGLDNRIYNLRKCTNAQNLWNSRFTYKGVYYREIRKRWVARIICNGKRIYLGSFKNKRDGVRVYREATELRNCNLLPFSKGE